jgi:hypothetical protein
MSLLIDSQGVYYISNYFMYVFKIINHGLPETLRDEMLKGCQSFFNQTEEEKKEFSGKQLFDPISYGTSFNTNIDSSFFWRDYLKMWVRPNFRAPHKPAGFRYLIFLSPKLYSTGSLSCIVRNMIPSVQIQLVIFVKLLIIPKT